MYVRTITAALVPGMADEAERIYNEQVVPRMREQDGYVSGSLFIDRKNMRAMTVSVWTDEASARATSEGSSYLTAAVNALRSTVAIKEVAHWDLAANDSAAG